MSSRKSHVRMDEMKDGEMLFCKHTYTCTLLKPTHRTFCDPVYCHLLLYLCHLSLSIKCIIFPRTIYLFDLFIVFLGASVSSCQTQLDLAAEWEVTASFLPPCSDWLNIDKHWADLNCGLSSSAANTQGWGKSSEIRSTHLSATFLPL